MKISITRFASAALVLTIGLLSTACSTSPAASLANDLNLITIAADVVPAAIPNLSPEAAACISEVAPLVSTIASVIEGSNPLAQAESAVTGLQTLASSTCATSAIPAKDQAIVTGVTKAIQDFLKLYQAQAPAAQPTAAIVARGYAMGFVDSPKVKTAKYKPTRGEKKKAKEAKERAAKIAKLFPKK